MTSTTTSREIPLFLDLPREIYDEIVDICLAIGGTPLLQKCTMVHTALLPRVYTYLFANISFYPRHCLEVQDKDTRVSTFISILSRRPYVARMVRSVTLYLHKDNDWLLDEAGFLAAMRLLRDLGALPTGLSIYRLPGVDCIRLPTHHKLETEVIRPILSSSVKYLTIRDCKDIQTSFLSAFTALEGLVLDKVSLSAATFKCHSNSPSFRKIHRLEIRRCLQHEGMSALLNPWCGLPFDLSTLRELQCPVENVSDMMFIHRAITSPGISMLQELRLIFDVATNVGRLALGHLLSRACNLTLHAYDITDRLTLPDAPSGIVHLRLTLILKTKRSIPSLDSYQTLVDSLTSLVSSKIHSTTRRLTVDFPDAWMYSSFEGTHEPRWDRLRQQIELWMKNNIVSPEGKLTPRQRHILDVRLNFVTTSAAKNRHQVDMLHPSVVPSPYLEQYFPGWHTFEYVTSTIRWSGVPFRHSIYAHSSWPHPLSFPELDLGMQLE